jgi:hypothetical protein
VLARLRRLDRGPWRFNLEEAKVARPIDSFENFFLIIKFGVEESIVNAPLVSLQIKTQTTQKVRLDLNS